jgi:hypothetical protein
MTSIIVLLWLSDICASVSFIGMVCSFACGLLVVILICSALGLVTEGDTDEAKRHAHVFWRYGRWLLIPIFIALLCPSKETLQAAVVGRAIEQVSQTALGADATAALHRVLQKVGSNEK